MHRMSQHPVRVNEALDLPEAASACVELQSLCTTGILSFVLWPLCQACQARRHASVGPTANDLDITSPRSRCVGRFCRLNYNAKTTRSPSSNRRRPFSAIHHQISPNKNRPEIRSAISFSWYTRVSQPQSLSSHSKLFHKRDMFNR